MSRAAGVGVVFGNSILLVKRVEKYNGKPIPFGGYWSIFTGGIEPKESAMNCAIRELFEEAQIKIKIEDLKYVKTIHNEFSTLTVYMTEVKELINPILNDEHTEFGWFDVDKLDHFQEDIDPTIVHCIKKYIKTRFTL